MDLDDFIVAVFCVLDEAILRVTHGHPPPPAGTRAALGR